MKTFAKTLAVVAIAAASATPAQAWWGPWGNTGYGGGPWNGFGDLFGDVSFYLSMRGGGRGNGYGSPYYYGNPYGYGLPYAPVAPLAPADTTK